VARVVYTLRRQSANLSPKEEETDVTDVAGAARSSTLTRVLCLVVLLGMVVAVTYVVWIATLNFSRIHV
jgi:hypothetical protein